jgi:hypothetical protein
MNKLASIAIGVLFTILLLGCNKGNDQPVNDPSSAFIEALHAKDAEKAEAQIRTMLKPYSETNIQSFASSLSARFPLTIVLICYDCVMTIPRITEIKIEYTYSGARESRFLDMLPDGNAKMHLAAVHE